jgi:hypothetical protein
MMVPVMSADGEAAAAATAMAAAAAEVGRQARVLRYKEKRRTRLFSKTIRYEVRKLNAERRPRMKVSQSVSQSAAIPPCQPTLLLVFPISSPKIEGPTTTITGKTNPILQRWQLLKDCGGSGNPW